MEIVHKKNTSYYLTFALINTTTPGSFSSGETPTLEAYYKIGAGAWTSYTLSGSATEISATGVYQITLSTSDLNYDQVLIKYYSTNGADSFVLFRLNSNDIEDFNLSSGVVESNIKQVNDESNEAVTLQQALAGTVTGQAVSGTLSTTQMSTNLTEATDDHYIGRIITWTSGALKGQSTDITDYDGTSKILTFTTVTEAPSNGDAFTIT